MDLLLRKSNCINFAYIASHKMCCDGVAAFSYYILIKYLSFYNTFKTSVKLVTYSVSYFITVT